MTSSATASVITTTTIRDPIRLEQQQRRLRILYHAAHCEWDDNPWTCPYDRHCFATRRLLDHMVTCPVNTAGGIPTQDCPVPGCRKSALLWKHYWHCLLMAECPICSVVPCRPATNNNNNINNNNNQRENRSPVLQMQRFPSPQRQTMLHDDATILSQQTSPDVFLHHHHHHHHHHSSSSLFPLPVLAEEDDSDGNGREEEKETVHDTHNDDDYNDDDDNDNVLSPPRIKSVHHQQPKRLHRHVKKHRPPLSPIRHLFAYV